jgi:hypothetical protein
MTAASNRQPSSKCKLSPLEEIRDCPLILLLVAFFICIVWIVATRFRAADEPLDQDICTYILTGRFLADGGKLYVDTLEFKPPGMFVIWQMIHQLVGSGPQVVLWVNILTTTLTMIGVFMAGSAKPWGRMGGNLGHGLLGGAEW